MLTFEKEVRVVKDVQGQEFYANNIPDALEAALKAAAGGGYVASFPQLVHARLITENGSDPIWQKWWTANGSENVGKTKQGKPVVLTINGQLPSPDRIRQALREGLIGGRMQHTDEEFQYMLTDPNVPELSYKEVKEGKNLPILYRVVTDFNEEAKLPSGYEPIDRWRGNQRFIIRAGGEEKANQILDRSAQVYNTKKYGNWTFFKDANPDKPQGLVPVLGDGGDYGFDGSFLGSNVRFGGVAPEALVAREKFAPTLEQISDAMTDLIAPKNMDLVQERLRQLYK
ncbi:MAG: hypothetical protein V1725_06715 [archaeon]